MQFISRLLLSWALFFFFLAQAIDDDNVVTVLLPVLWLPSILFIVALTYLVHDKILSQLSAKLSLYAAFFSPVNLTEPIAPVAPATQIIPTTLSVDVIDRAQVQTWHGLSDGCIILVLFVAFVVVILIARLWNHHRLPHVRPVSSKVGRFPSLFKRRLSRRGSLVPKPQRADVFCPSYSPYSRPSNDPESATTLNQTDPNYAPALALPPPVENDSPQPSQSDHNADESLPLLGWNFTASPAFQDGDDDDMVDDDDDEQWWDTDDQQPIQIKEVTRGVVPFPSYVDDDSEEGEDAVVSSASIPTPITSLRPLIPTGQLNPNIEFLELGSNQETIRLSSYADEKDEDATPTTATPAGGRRARLRVPAQKPDPRIQSLPPREAQWIPSLGSCKEQDEDDEDHVIRERHPSLARPRAPSRALPPMPMGPHNTRVELIQGITPLPTCVEEEEEEEEEEDPSNQDRHPWSSSKPNRDASTSTTITAVEAPTNNAAPNACGKPSAMKNLGPGAPRKMATVSWFHFVKTRNLPATVYDGTPRSFFVTEEEGKELNEEHIMQQNLLPLGGEEAEVTNWVPFERGELPCQPSLLSWNAEPQDNATPESVGRGLRLRKVLAKLSPIRFGKRLFKKRTGPL